MLLVALEESGPQLWDPIACLQQVLISAASSLPSAQGLEPQHAALKQTSVHDIGTWVLNCCYQTWLHSNEGSSCEWYTC